MLRCIEWTLAKVHPKFTIVGVSSAASVEALLGQSAKDIVDVQLPLLP